MPQVWMLPPFISFFIYTTLCRLLPTFPQSLEAKNWLLKHVSNASPSEWVMIQLQFVVVNHGKAGLL